MMTGRGRFITFEGGEGVGKSTQIRALAAVFEAQGIPVVLTREPGGTPLAEVIRKVILSPDGSSDAMTQALLFAAARRDHVRNLIEPALRTGKTVLCDRFADSTRAYQGGLLSAETLETTIALATGGLRPDITILLDLAPAVGLARAARRNAATDTFETAHLDFHAEVRARFLALARAEPQRFAIIDAGRDSGEVATAIRLCVEARLARMK